MKNFIKKISNWSREVKIILIITILATIIFGTVAMLGLNNKINEPVGGQISTPDITSTPGEEATKPLEENIFNHPVTTENVEVKYSFYSMDSENDKVMYVKDGVYYNVTGTIYGGQLAYSIRSATQGKIIGIEKESELFKGMTIYLLSKTGVVTIYSGIESTSLKVGDEINEKENIGKIIQSKLDDVTAYYFYFKTFILNKMTNEYLSDTNFEHIANFVKPQGRYVNPEICINKTIKDLFK